MQNSTRVNNNNINSNVIVNKILTPSVEGSQNVINTNAIINSNNINTLNK